MNASTLFFRVYRKTIGNGERILFWEMFGLFRHLFRKIFLDYISDLQFFFEMEEPPSCIEKKHTTFFIKLFAKVLQKAYIKITRSHHSTPRSIFYLENEWVTKMNDVAINVWHRGNQFDVLFNLQTKVFAEYNTRFIPIGGDDP
jgi:hypothetical protein